MKNVNFLLRLSISLFLSISLLFMSSCKKDEVQNLDGPQIIMYTPTSDLDGLSMKFAWNALPNANYIFEISSDNFVNNIDTLVFNKDTTSASISGLTSNTMLYARIKAISKDDVSKFADFRNSTLFLYENVFLNQTNDVLSVSSVTKTTVKLSWAASKNVTSIVKIKAGVSDTTLLQPADLAAKTITFSGLSIDSDYSFKIYNRNVLRGVVAARTNLY
jgi:hypothetical protein